MVLLFGSIYQQILIGNGYLFYLFFVVKNSAFQCRSTSNIVVSFI